MKSIMPEIVDLRGLRCGATRKWCFRPLLFGRSSMFEHDFGISGREMETSMEIPVDTPEMGV